jgi:hypothetical protein
MRKIALLVCLFLLPLPAVLAAGGTVSVKPIEKVVQVGDMVKIDIRGANLTDLHSVKFEVVYENRNLSYKEYELGSLCSNDPKPTMVPPVAKRNGDITKIYVGISFTKPTQNFAQSGTFFTLKFQAIDGAKSTPIKITGLEGRNHRFEIVPLTAENAEIEIRSLPIKPILVADPKELDFGTLQSGQSKTLKVHVSNEGKEGLRGTIEPDNTWIEADPPKFEKEELDVSITVSPVVGQLLNMQHVGYVQIVTNGGSTSIRCRFYYQETAIDDLPPDLTITEPKDKSLVNKQNITVKGRTNPGVSILVGGNAKDVNEDGSFEFQHSLHEGENKLTVTARKDSGKTTDVSVTITLDSMPPPLTVKDPVPTVHTSPIWVEGATEKTATVRANGKSIKPDINGNFKVMFELKPGENKLEIIAADEAGNTTPWGKTVKFVPQEVYNIKMWVGKPEAYVNGNLVYLEVPPTIVANKTFVPLRFISENFKADVKWDAATRSVTVNGQSHSSTVFIGSQNAFLDGQPKLLEAAPFIKNGKTMVPLRFIAQDTLAATIDWNGEEKRIELVLTIDIKTP